MSKINISISVAALIGAILGYFIWRKRALGGFWGALLGLFLLPLIVWAASKVVGISTT